MSTRERAGIGRAAGAPAPPGVQPEGRGPWLLTPISPPAKSRIAIVGVAVVIAWLGMGYRLSTSRSWQRSRPGRCGPQPASGLQGARPATRQDLRPQRELLAMTVDSKELVRRPFAGGPSRCGWHSRSAGFLGVDIDTLYERLTSDRQLRLHQAPGRRECSPSRCSTSGWRACSPIPSPPGSTPRARWPAMSPASSTSTGWPLEGLELVYEDQLRGCPGQSGVRAGSSTAPRSSRASRTSSPPCPASTSSPPSTCRSSTRLRRRVEALERPRPKRAGWWPCMSRPARSSPWRGPVFDPVTRRPRPGASGRSRHVAACSPTSRSGGSSSPGRPRS
jgi:hypothetical protein